MDSKHHTKKAKLFWGGEWRPERNRRLIRAICTIASTQKESRQIISAASRYYSPAINPSNQVALLIEFRLAAAVMAIHDVLEVVGTPGNRQN